jgi:hypothetical protein
MKMSKEYLNEREFKMKQYQTISIKYFDEKQVYVFDILNKKEIIIKESNIENIINKYNQDGFFISAVEKHGYIDCVYIMTKELSN